MLLRAANNSKSDWQLIFLPVPSGTVLLNRWCMDQAVRKEEKGSLAIEERMEYDWVGEIEGDGPEGRGWNMTGKGR
jgi:hypothetical protein